METHMRNMSATMKSLETQIGQLANALRDQNRGQFPSNTEVNPKEQCKAVTLRCGKKLEAQSPKEGVENMEEEHDAPLIFGRILGDWKDIDRYNWEVKEQLVALEAPQKERRKDAPNEELNVNEKIEVKPSSLDLKELPSHLCYAFLGEKSTYPVIISSSLTCDQKEKLLRVLRKYKNALGWSISDIRGISPIICMHRILMKDSYTLSVDHQRRLNLEMKELVKNEVLKLLNAGVIYAISDSSWVSPVLAGYCFLNGYLGYNQIVIAPEDQEKTTFTCPYDTFVFRRMPFGLCNSPATFQRCMMAIFSDMVDEIMEVFKDEFSRCQDKNLVLNWEKCHFMVQEGIVLGHKVSSKGLEVDRAKVVAIEKLPPPRNIKEIKSFLGHARFYRRFIKDFSKITKPLCNLLEKDSDFIFDDDCLQAFEKIKKALVTAPIMIVPDWKEPFELMCDASDYAVGPVLGQ
ncbi:uncharacterized protein [Primulina eburnea]|uniref:uncharacterized protein n=1 Tax=Primulina eburnea TaxID=1245227 RepID=UPI003C6C1F97